QDANYNVTALVNSSGSVVERDVYDPYGKVTFLNASWGTLTGSAYAWIYLFQGTRLDQTSNLFGDREREESSSLGRWDQVDPLGLAGGDTNLYRSFAHPDRRRRRRLRDPVADRDVSEVNKQGGDLLVYVAGVPTRSHEDVVRCVHGQRGAAEF